MGSRSTVLLQNLRFLFHGLKDPSCPAPPRQLSRLAWRRKANKTFRTWDWPTARVLSRNTAKTPGKRGTSGPWQAGELSGKCWLGKEGKQTCYPGITQGSGGSVVHMITGQREGRAVPARGLCAHLLSSSLDFRVFTELWDWLSFFLKSYEILKGRKKPNKLVMICLFLKLLLLARSSFFLHRKKKWP